MIYGFISGLMCGIFLGLALGFLIKEGELDGYKENQRARKSKNKNHKRPSVGRIHHKRPIQEGKKSNSKTTTVQNMELNSNRKALPRK